MNYEVSKIRQSNMELLRITAMLMVLCLHATFETFGWPRASMVQGEPWRWLALMVVNALTLPCVDVFVLITGWFGTRFSLRGTGRLVFQIGFVGWSMCLLLPLWALPQPADAAGWLKVLTGYWFPCSYLVLYLFTPMLNAWVEQTGEAQQRRTLLVLFGLLIPASLFLDDLRRGFAAVPFMALYLLGRHLRLYVAPRWASVPRSHFVWGYAFTSLASALLLWGLGMTSQRGIDCFIPLYSAYTSPLVLFQSCMLLLLFARLQFSSRVVNWVAAGSFAVYLTHQQPYVRAAFYQLLRHVHATHAVWASPLLIAGILLAVFLASVVLDALRRLAWSGLEKMVTSLVRRAASFCLKS